MVPLLIPCWLFKVEGITQNLMGNALSSSLFYKPCERKKQKKIKVKGFRRTEEKGFEPMVQKNCTLI